jgi:hypothetical protein
MKARVPLERTKRASVPLEDPELDYDEGDQAPRTPQMRKKIARPAAEEASPQKSAGTSLASFFDKAIVTVSGDADNIPIGNYEAIITEVVEMPFDSLKGQSVRMKFELCDPDLENKNQVTTWFKVVNANEEVNQGGARAFMATLTRLGYKVSSGEEARAAMAEIGEEQPGVIVKISYSNDPEKWQRAVVMNTCDNDVVEAYKDRAN